MYDVSLISVMD